MESPACIKQSQGHGCACSRGHSHECSVILSARSGDSNHSTSAMESPVCIKQNVVVYALEMTPLVFTICRMIMVRLVVWAVACLIQLAYPLLSLQLVCNQGNYSMIKATLQRGNNKHLQSLVKTWWYHQYCVNSLMLVHVLLIGIKNVTYIKTQISLGWAEKWSVFVLISIATMLRIWTCEFYFFKSLEILYFKCLKYAAA